MLVGLLGLVVAAQAGAAARVGAPLPALKLPNVSGKLVPLRDDTAEVTVINFWASWCGPCRDEIPELVKVHERYGGHHVRVIGIAVDSGTPKEIEAFARKHGINYAVLVADTAWVRQHFGLAGVPVTLIVGDRGIIEARLSGPQTAERLIYVIRQLLWR